MRLVEFLGLYLSLGIGAILILRRSRTKISWVDMIFIVCLWPLYVPSLFSKENFRQNVQEQNNYNVQHEIELLIQTLQQIENIELRAKLPTETQLQKLAEHLTWLAQRVHNLETTLAQKEFDLQTAERALELAAHKGGVSLHSAQMVCESIRKMIEMHLQAVRERDELIELCIRLRMQMTAIRLTGIETQDMSELVGEILGRVFVANAHAQ